MADATLSTESTVQDLSACLKKLEIEVPASAVDAHIDESIDTLAAEAALPGFRKGRAPRRLVEKKFGSAIRDESKGRLISQAFQEAVEKHELKVVGEPQGDELADVAVEPGKALKFSIEVEVTPEFELPSLEGIAVKKPTYEIVDETVEQELEKLCVQEGDLEEQDAAAAGDYLTGHGIMTGGDGTEFHNIPGAVVQIPAEDKGGKGMILGVMVDDFSKQLGLPKAGDTATIKTKGPENHEVEGIRGADLTVTFKVDSIQRIIPAKSEDISARLGFEDVDTLKSGIRARLEQRAAVDQQTAMRNQVAKHLADSVDFELPERLSAQQAQRTLDRRRLELMYRGVSAEQIEEHVAELRAASTETTARELKLYFILHSAAEKLETEVSEAELNGQIARLAVQNGRRPEQFRQQMIKSNRIQGLYQQLREHKTMDAILAKAEIEEVSAEDYKPDQA